MSARYELFRLRYRYSKWHLDTFMYPTLDKREHRSLPRGLQQNKIFLRKTEFECAQ